MMIAFYEKLETGALRKINERPWDQQLIHAMDAANYVWIEGKEYEMVEGRLNIDIVVLELLLVAVQDTRL